MSLCLTSLGVIISRSSHGAAKSMVSFFLWLSSISLCVCVCAYARTHVYVHTYTRVHTRTHTCACTYTCIYLLYPLLCQWTFQLSPHPGCCKQCCCEHGVHQSFWIKSTVRPEGTSMFSFWGTCRLFHSGCISLHPHKPCRRYNNPCFFKTVAISSDILYLLIILQD